MQRYWLRIALGALGIFVLGMAAISIYRNGVRKVETLANSADPITIPLAILPFRLDGDQLGRIEQVQIRRESPKRVSGVGLVVKTQDSAAADAALSPCLLTIREEAVQQHGPTFHCATPADSLADSLTVFGDVRFEPGGMMRAFFLPARVVAEWREGRSELFSFDQDHPKRGSQRRATIRIGNDSGDALFELHADSTGARLRVRDDTGHDVMLLDADSTGARLMVRDDSARRKGSPNARKP
jgi:hypothetical protein